MIKIECDVWEKRQLLEYLDYSKKKMQEDFNGGRITLECLIFEHSKIDNLKSVVNGKTNEDYLLRSKEFRQKYYNNDELTPVEKELKRAGEMR